MPEALLTRRDGIELARVGSWPTSTGRWDATATDFAAAVEALSCPAVRKPRLWIGHTDQRFTPRSGDGEPAIGWVENLRADGDSLVGDYVGIPAWLDQVMASAYPDRSIEGAYNRLCALGHRHPFVIDGVALLGVTRPGVGVLEPLSDLDGVKALYGLAASGDEPSDGEERIMATIPGDTIAAATQPHTGAMVALIPTAEDAERLAVEGGEPVEQLHVTLAYLGKADQIPDRARQQVIGEVMRAVAGLPPLTVDAFAVSAFNPSNPDRETCVVLTLSGDGLADAKALVGAAVMHAQHGEVGFVTPEQHTPWLPHITLEYTDDLTKVVEYADRTGPITFDRVRVVFGGDATDLPLTGTPDGGEVALVDLLPVAATAGDANLRNYWLRGEGAAKIRWGTPGDFTRCVRNLRGKLRDPKGYCAELHFEANGFWPGDRRNRDKVAAAVPDSPAAEPETATTEMKEDIVSDLSEFRSRLGLSDDADQAAVLAAIDALKTKADTPPEPTPEQVAASAAAAEEAERKVAAATAEAADLRKEVEILASTVKDVTAKLAASEAEKTASVKASVLDAAIKDGKIAPAAREQWEKDYDEAPAAVTRVLASIAPGTAVPVTVAGETGDPDGVGGDDAAWARDFARLFPAETSSKEG